ncbi:MAG: hypothetical protein IPK65_02315 [Gammaproteobacteria bacterium]|nr:hypothetical protein [Gammaproteobacteria bacterium]
MDDTIAGQLGKTSDVSLDQSSLLQFIGMGDDLEPHIGEIYGVSNDLFVLTTDGVHYLAPTPGWMGQIVANAPDAGICAKRLVDLSKWCGGYDNSTVAVIPLFIHNNPDSKPYKWFEVWDAFGEINIIASEPGQEISRNRLTSQRAS